MTAKGSVMDLERLQESWPFTEVSDDQNESPEFLINHC